MAAAVGVSSGVEVAAQLCTSPWTVLGSSSSTTCTGRSVPSARLSGPPSPAEASLFNRTLYPGERAFRVRTRSISCNCAAASAPLDAQRGDSWSVCSLLKQPLIIRRIDPVMASIQRETVGPGQESVWDYPRPPRLEPVQENIKIVFNGETIADTTHACRVLETSHPPVYYIPTTDIKMNHITLAPGSSLCEWKGEASWWSLSVGAKTAERVAWSYESPTELFLPIKGFLAFYAGPMDACFVGDEKAEPQPGNFYGGWVTSKVVGPFKGGPGSWGW